MFFMLHPVENCVLLLMICRTAVHSINQPKLCASATWNASGITFADNNTVGPLPRTVFVTGNNSVYVAANHLHQILMWTEGNANPVGNITGGLLYPQGLFVTNNDDVYFDHGLSYNQIVKWLWNTSNYTALMNVSDRCVGIFVDSNQSLYCSLSGYHQVIRMSLNSSQSNLSETVAGTGTSGATSHTLDQPHGIFIDIHFSLYVADAGNNRVQRFRAGQLKGTTLAGAGAPETITLSTPKAVVLDGDGYLFIVDSNHHRIVASSPNGFRCIVGCTGISGSASDQLNAPWGISFDSYGNLFVSDQNNARIQKFALVMNSCGPSYNAPKLCPWATWNPDAVTFADNTIVGSVPHGIYVDLNNTVYVAETWRSYIQVWLEGSVDPIRNITGAFVTPFSIFASITGDIYVDNGLRYRQVNKWTPSTATGTVEMTVDGACYGLFVDSNDNLYCSEESGHQVVKQLSGNVSNSTVVVAGNGSAGSAPNMLYSPRGIFVSRKFELYVADCYNFRVQRFQPNQVNGTTVAGNGAPGTIALNCPVDVVLDADEYVFIADFYNHRVVGSGPSGFRCVVGCTGVWGSTANKLFLPHSLSFDSHGNIYVADTYNSRIQKFHLATNSCGLACNQPRLPLCAKWTSSAVTFANSSVFGQKLRKVLVDVNNTVYITGRDFNGVHFWLDGTNTSIGNISSGLNDTYTVFASVNGDVYIDNGQYNDRVDKWTSNTTNSTIAMYVNGPCYGLFVDVLDNLYCSVGGQHQVVKKLLSSAPNMTTVVAGTGVAGSGSYMLNDSRGIFVDGTFDLYVADCKNNRVQRFHSNELNGTTVAGSGASGTMTLSSPSEVVLDGNGYLYIVEYNGHRIVGQGPSGFRCIVGCINGQGSAPDQLYLPASLSFDIYGNLFVADTGNNRIQKFLLASDSCRVSVNQPILSPCASWTPNAVTFADSSAAGAVPRQVFVDVNNTVYITGQDLNGVRIWLDGTNTSIRNISSGLNDTYTVFASVNGDIYIDNGQYNDRVDKWTSNTTNSTTAMYVNGPCYGLFVDVLDNLYCSVGGQHQVVKKLLSSAPNMTTVVAGTGVAGSASHTLKDPRGLFVDGTLDLYVADCGNDRVQRFHSNELNGMTVAGSGASGTMTLSCPIEVVLDGNGYLYIVEYNGHRVVRGSLYGFRCIIGCTGVSGSAPNQLYRPHSLSFDSHGNLFVADGRNNRTQKFVLATNSCSFSYNLPKLSLCTSWNPNATTFANSSVILDEPRKVFVDNNNTIYVTGRQLDRVRVWLNGSNLHVPTVPGDLNVSYAVFVSNTGDIYVDNGRNNGQVDRYTLNAANSTIEMIVPGRCCGLFIDIQDSLYCSLADQDQVIKKLSNQKANESVVVGGNGNGGNDPYSLSSPQGLFVDIDLNLYVADANNDRIQLFRFNELYGRTLAGNGAPGTVTLSHPTDVILDGDGYMFIVEYYGHRVVGQGPYGFRCVAGCTVNNGSAADQLTDSFGLSFDSYGNLFVSDTGNDRLQLFRLATNSCSQSTGASSNTVAMGQSTALGQITTTSAIVTNSWNNGGQSPASPFHPTTCPISTQIGASCNLSATLCDMLRPCQHSALCVNNITSPTGYTCSCPSYFYGSQCQLDQRPCQPTTCLHNGTCFAQSNTTFRCHCDRGWQGDHCETMINYCDQITCQNNGICQPHLLNYSCLCLGVSYSGDHCEITSKSTRVSQMVSRSFGYVAIIAIGCLVLFIVTMDVLKYVFRIDPVDRYKKRTKRKTQVKPPVRVRFIYVNAPPSSNETTV